MSSYYSVPEYYNLFSRVMLSIRLSFYSLVVSFLFQSPIINIPTKNCPIRFVSFLTILGNIKYRILGAFRGFDPQTPAGLYPRSAWELTAQLFSQMMTFSHCSLCLQVNIIQKQIDDSNTSRSIRATTIVFWSNNLVG